MPRRRPRSSFSTGVSPTFPCPCYASLSPPLEREREREGLLSGIVGPTGPESFALLSHGEGGGAERRLPVSWKRRTSLFAARARPPEIRNSVPLNSVEIPQSGAAAPRKLRGLVYSRACRRALRETAETADIPDEAPIPRQEVCQDTPRGSLLVTLDWRLHS